MFVIIGDPYRAYAEPKYCTDPREYSLPVFKHELTEEEFSEYRGKIKAFVNRDDAIGFAYHCNLDSVQCLVYDREGDEWIYNSEETRNIAEEIS